MAEELVTDLFGVHEMPVRLRRGKPPHRWNSETANKIKLLLAMGWTNERIAHACGISQPTLRKYYFSVLKARDAARDVVEARRVELLFKAASGGNVGAIKELGKVLSIADSVKALEARLQQSEKHAVNAPKGLKEKRQQAAEEVEGLYAAPEGPSLQ